jgi:hypothetical protein
MTHDPICIVNRPSFKDYTVKFSGMNEREFWFAKDSECIFCYMIAEARSDERRKHQPVQGSVPVLGSDQSNTPPFTHPRERKGMTINDIAPTPVQKGIKSADDIILARLARALSHLDHALENDRPLAGYFRAYREILAAFHLAEAEREFDRPHPQKYAAISWDLSGLLVAIENVTDRPSLINRINDVRLLVTNKKEWK